MIVFDIGSVAWLSTILGFLKIAWDVLRKASTWLLSKALALFLGSKFWGLFACFALSVLVVGMIATLLDVVVSWSLNAVVSSTFSVDDLSLFTVVGGEHLVDIVSAFLSLFLAAFAVRTTGILSKLTSGVYFTLVHGWKL